jgi:queuine tRNA-ribosyltransferase
LHHLFRAEEMLGPMLLTAHNLTYYQSLMQAARAAILNQTYAAYCASVRAGWEDG